MITVNFRELELGEFWHDEAPRDRGRGGFPLVTAEGTENLGMVYFEIAPGDSLGMHTDSKDELVIVLSGDAVATIGDEHGELVAGMAAFVPAMVPHGFTNIGTETLKVIGVFAGTPITATFRYPLQPWGTHAVEIKSPAALAVAT